MSFTILFTYASLATVGHARIPTKTLPSGVQLPMLYMGAGNFTQWLKLTGLGGGIKTAWEYGDESQKSMLPQVQAAGLRREDVFLETMIPCGGIDGSVEPMNATQAESYIKRDLELLGTSYIDLLLLHHRCEKPAETQAVWKVLEAAFNRGDARAIGVSNFVASDLAKLLLVATVPVSVNEAHFAVGMMDYETTNFCNEHNISLVSFSSLSAGVPMNHGTLTAVAKKHNVSNAQIMYRFVSVHGIAILSSFGKPQHALDDIGIFDIELDEQDMTELKCLQTSKQTCADCFTKECQACASLLQQLVCPIGTRIPVWGRDNPDSAACVACAGRHNATSARSCALATYPDMINKACGTAGGFPRQHMASDLIV